MHTIEWYDEPSQRGRADGFVDGVWWYIIRNNTTSVWDEKIEQWSVNIDHESYEAAKQWCEMYEVTGARQNHSV